MTKIRIKITKKILKQVEKKVRVLLDIAPSYKVKVTVFNDYDEDGNYSCFNCDSTPNFKINDGGEINYYCGRCN